MELHYQLFRIQLRYECKWSVKKEAKAPKLWQATYPQAEFQVIHLDNSSVENYNGLRQQRIFHGTNTCIVYNHRNYLHQIRSCPNPL